MNPDVIAIGTFGSIVTEIFKYVPFLNTSNLTRSLTAIVVILIGTVLTTGKFDISTFVQSLIVALVAYKSLIQPVAGAAGLRTQK